MRTLHAAGAEMIGADARRLPFGLHSRYTPPYEEIAHENSASFVEQLVNALDKHQPDVLLPIGTGSACSRAKDTLDQRTNLLIPKFDTFSSVDDKRKIVDQCRRNEIRTPQLLDAGSAKKALRSGLFEAVIVKPRSNLGGGEGVTIATSANELCLLTTDIERRYGEALIAEFVPGPDDSNIAVQVVFDRNSRLIGHFIQQKTRLQPPRVGLTAAAVSVHRPDLLKLVIPLFSRLRWQGPADIEFKIDSRTGEAWLIEVNARFSGAVGFAIACGVNLPLLACKASLGQNLPESTVADYRAGVKYWNPVMYMRAITTAVRFGKSPARLPAQIYNELRGDRVGSPYRISDPAPVIGKALYQLRERFSKRTIE